MCQIGGNVVNTTVRGVVVESSSLSSSRQVFVVGDAGERRTEDGVAG